MRWLALCSLFMCVTAALVLSYGFYELARFAELWHSGKLAILTGLSIAPLIVGTYYWVLLREEEILVTDDGIERRSRWGDEVLLWRDVQEFQCHAVRFGDTHLGQIVRLASLFGEYTLFLDGRPLSYELVATDRASGQLRTMVLEPGTIEEMPWLLTLIEEHVGAAKQVGLALPV